MSSTTSASAAGPVQRHAGAAHGAGLGSTRNGQTIELITLDPDRDAVVGAVVDEQSAAA